MPSPAIKLYATKPVTIEAVQWDGTEAGVALVETLTPVIVRNSRLWVETPNGLCEVRKQDWVSKGPDQKIHVTAPDYFADFFGLVP